jgi:hemerythrin-like metal-binding protein
MRVCRHRLEGASMSTFSVPWTQGLSLPAEYLTEEHKGLLDKVNRLLEAVARQDKTSVVMAFGVLRIAAQEHFDREEASMRSAQYPETERHCASHQELLRGLDRLQVMLETQDRYALTVGPFMFLEQWFEKHLTHDDKRLAEFLAQQSPAPPTAAG